MLWEIGEFGSDLVLHTTIQKSVQEMMADIVNRQPCGKHHPLTVTELPFPLPAIDTRMIWHEKNDRDPFHQWLCDRMSGEP